MSLGRRLPLLLLCLGAMQAPAQQQNPYDDPDEIAAWNESIERMTEFGLQYETAWHLYQALKEEAGGGMPMTWNRVPDWGGLWTRDYTPGGSSSPWSLDVLRSSEDRTKLAPEADAEWRARQARAREGILYDPISDCTPTGFPRWMTAPFTREHIVKPEQVWLITEQVNEVRRIYTDGRDHTPESDRYPMWLGDSVGFWDDQKLVIHTNQLRAGIYGRNAPMHSDQVEVVEIWEQTGPHRLEVDAWIYDPAYLLEPWFVKIRHIRIPNDDKFIRLRHFVCSENPNNAVYQTEEGGTEYRNLDFSSGADSR